MKSFTIPILLILSFTLQSFSQEKINWIKNYDEAARLSRESGKPMLIDFWATWCGPCKVMERDFWPRADVISESGKFIMVSIEADKYTSIATKFLAGGLPHIIFADPWGNVIARQKGFGSGSDRVVLSKMKAMPGDFIPVREWLAALAADKENKTALENLGTFYRDAKAYDLSNNYYRKRLEVAVKEANAVDTEDFMMRIGTNTFKMQELGSAQKIFEEVIKGFPEGKLTERAYISLITCQAFRKKLSDAEKTLGVFKSLFPDSKFIAEASQAIEQIKRLAK